MRDLKWLVARPIAHRGLHGGAIIENTATAFSAALEHDYSIECDLQLTADGEAVVFHDDEVDRLLTGRGLVKHFTVKQLQAMAFHSGSDRVQTLAELLDQVAGNQVLVIEIKTQWDDDMTLTKRALKVLEHYSGPFALMSFDPAIVACLAELSSTTPRGITADRVDDPYYDRLSAARRQEMRNFSHVLKTQPHFVSFDFKGLPFAPVEKLKASGHKIITWTIETAAEAAQALQHSDQITFQFFHPK
jgi:glycerophosphoryl diester phosphodiesterase